MPNIDEVLAKPINALDRLTVFAKKVDTKWHEPLELKEKLLACAEAFLKNTHNEVSDVFDKMPENKKYIYNVLLMISANSLRMTDAVLSLVQVGHPDAALAITRTLFEACVDAVLIKLDATGQRAKQYIEYDWADMQKRLITTDDQIVSQSQNRGSSHWTKIPDDPNLKLMKDKLDYIKLKLALNEGSVNFLKNVWTILNKWAHMSPIASGHLLCTRGSENYGNLTYVLGKSCIGLNAPMTDTGFILILTLKSYFEFSSEFTNNIYDNNENLLRDIWQKMDDSIKGNSGLSDYRITPS